MSTTDITAKDFNPSNNEMVDLIKSKANDLSDVINQLPDSHRRTVSLDHLEAASMFAVKSIFYNDRSDRT